MIFPFGLAVFIEDKVTVENKLAAMIQAGSSGEIEFSLFLKFIGRPTFENYLNCVLFMNISITFIIQVFL